MANLALVGFHTAFNLIGAATGVMLAAPFARLLFFLVPGEEPRGVQRFDFQLLAEPEAAIEPLTVAARELAALTVGLWRIFSPPAAIRQTPRRWTRLQAS
ncbi:MAG: hypothetical protein FJX29_10285, partial [Alphaproteobacteria bacterium]|nr:hypothetical protein [Alphaproteobacteria bacterium]